MTVIEDAAAAFEEQAREFVRGLEFTPERERLAEVDAAIDLFSGHRYLFVRERALAVLVAARAELIP
jgi:hypothetical protein